MLQSISVGPFALPTAPLFAVLAVMIGLDMAGRYGRYLRLSADDVWNTGMIALIACLIGARLWNVLQFWEVYLDEPGLIFSLRPSGFVWGAGTVAGLIAGYAYMIAKSLDPLRVATAFLVGASAGWVVQSFSNYLTGNLLGGLTTLPWAISYFNELRHPVALYEMLGAMLLLAFTLLFGKRDQPKRTLFGLLLGWSLLLLLTRAFVDEPMTIGGLRLVQVVALLVGLVAVWRFKDTESANDVNLPVPLDAESGTRIGQ